MMTEQGCPPHFHPSYPALTGQSGYVVAYAFHASDNHHGRFSAALPLSFLQQQQENSPYGGRRQRR